MEGVARVARTVAVRSVRLSRRVFNVFAELEGIYRNMVEQLTIYAVRSGITSFTRLKALNYHGMRDLYPNIPSHYIYTACQDAKPPRSEGRGFPLRAGRRSVINLIII
ncbi:MAG: hypothetical protein QXQ57_06605 [Sulfolobales archaeon]